MANSRSKLSKCLFQKLCKFKIGQIVVLVKTINQCPESFELIDGYMIILKTENKVFSIYTVC